MKMKKKHQFKAQTIVYSFAYPWNNEMNFSI